MSRGLSKQQRAIIDMLRDNPRGMTIQALYRAEVMNSKQSIHRALLSLGRRGIVARRIRYQGD